MASVSRSRRTTDERSGGKILRGRRIVAAKTPYDRPIPAEAPSRAPSQSPNWLTGFIFPTSRMIATGATKLLSVLASSSSSSSSSSSDSEDSSEDFMDDENDSHIPYDGVDELNEKNETTAQVVECFGKEHQQTLEKSETKCVIEKLLMQETFSREEGDRLIKIINSRVLNDSAMEERQDGRLDLCNKAVLEAKQWLEDKKVASSSKSDLNLGTCTPNSAVILQVTKGELGSPVDVAKSYMRARPPWASPSINNVESRTPSPIGRELLKEETPYSAAGNSFSSSKKIYSLASGLWNIQEEIRRVRSKASEDMIKTTPSIKTDLSAFSLEPKSIQKPLLADKTDLGRGEKVQELDYLPVTKSKDASPELPAGVSPHHGIPVLEITQDSSRNEDLSSHPVTSPSAQNKDLETIRTVEGEEHAASESRHLTIPDVALEHDAISSEKTCSSAKEETELRGNPNANGFPFSGPSFSAGHVDPNPRPADDKNPNPISSNHDKLGNSIPVDETCELLSEASVEVPEGNEINLITGDSQNSSSLQGEELSLELTQMNPEHALTVTGKTNNVVEKKHGRKMSRYNRKSRAKG